MRKRITAMAAMLLCAFLLLAGAGKSVVFASTKEPVEQFSGDVGFLKKDNGNYIMQVTAQNDGEDFSGTVQVVFANSYDNCAYNTEISLPAQGKKQFSITVPERAADTVRGMCALNFLDGKGKVVQSILLSNIFGNTMSGIPVGILSDDYSGLTYMDLGGEDFYIQDMEFPLKLIELDQDNLQTYLDGLYFLVIDRFNVSTLGEENIRLIQEWVENGGWLLIGTGSYAEQTLSGFEEDFLDVDILSVSEPGEENIAFVNADKYGYYYNYRDAEVDLTQMAAADLDYGKRNGRYYESSENPDICGSVGDGAVTVFYFSFGEKELQKLDTYVVRSIYEEMMYHSNSYRSYNGYSEMNYIGQRLLAFIDSNNTELDFSWLEILIAVYVVLVGPILYLILRKCKKSEWYWVGAPALGLVFIAGVYLFGQGAKVNETRVYSVAAQQAGTSRTDTYFLAYHSGVKEWNVRLDERYEAAGPGWSGYYRSYSANPDNYHYVVGNDSEGFSIGLKPQENFESGFFYAGGRAESRGNLSGTNIKEFNKSSGLNGSTSGTVTNETGSDLAYMAIWYHPYIMIFSDVKAGETLDLAQAIQEGRCVYQDDVNYFDTLMYDTVSIYGYRSNVDYDQNDMAALVIGLGIADESMPTDKPYAIVAGVVKDYEKAVVSKCHEISYGCLYSYIEMEGESHASN